MCINQLQSIIHKYYAIIRLSPTQKMNFCIKDFVSKWDQIRSFLQILSHLLKKPLMENFIFLQWDLNNCAPDANRMGLWQQTSETHLIFWPRTFYLVKKGKKMLDITLWLHAQKIECHRINFARHGKISIHALKAWKHKKR